MSALAIIDVWKRRLIAMANDPPYVFRDTPPELIAEHHRRLTNFIGFAEDKIFEAEQRLGGRFPTVFYAFLQHMARSPGDLFCGSELTSLSDLGEFRSAALALMAESDPELTLPHDAAVFLFHQGYSFLYLRLTGGFDGPVWRYTEGELQVVKVADAFANFVFRQLESMESSRAASRRNGGYYLTLYADGSGKQHHPALNSGERPFHTAQSPVCQAPSLWSRIRSAWRRQ